MESPDAHQQRQIAAVGGKALEQPREFAERCRRRRTRGERRGLLDRTVDHGDVDALRHDGVALRVRGDVDADEFLHVALQLGARKEHRVGGIRRQLLHQSGAEPEVLGLVDLAEVPAGETARIVHRVDHRVRVGGDGEDHRDVQLTGDVEGGQAADVRHSQVQQVDRAGGAEHPTDTAARRDPQRPGVGRLHGVAEQRDSAVDVPVCGAGDLEHALQRTLRGATGHGDHARDSAPFESVAKPHQQGGDAAVVAAPGLGEFGVDVGVQKQLGDGERRIGGAARERMRGKIDHGQACHVGEVPLARRELGEQGGDRRHLGALAERRDGRDPHCLVLVCIRGDAHQRAGGDAVAHQAETLHQAVSGGRVIDAEQCTLERQRDLRGGGIRPLFQGALREHAGEPAAHDQGDQSTDGVEARQPRTQGPGGVLPQVLALAREQPRQRDIRLLVVDLGKRVGGGDGGELVFARERGGEHANGARSPVTVGVEGEIVGETHRVDERPRLPHGVERCLDAHERVPSRPARGTGSPP